MDPFFYKRTYFTLLVLLLFFGGLTLLVGPGMLVNPLGSNDPELLDTFIFRLRLPRLLVAFFSGGSLALVALLLQTYFQNPLAGPFVLGIHSGAALGVALWIFFFESLALNIPQLMIWGQIPFAFLGSFLVILLLLSLMKKSLSKVLLLVVGLVFSYFVSGIINILISMSDSVQIKNFVLWNLGSFDRIQGSWLLFYAVALAFISTLTLFIAPSLNALTLGEEYATSLGVNIKQVRRTILIVSSLLTAFVIAFCGPIAFIGIISPHLLRRFVKGNDHYFLIPLVFLMGGVLAIMASFFSMSLPWFQLPLNAILGLFGAPILFFILTQKRMRGME